MATAEVQRDVRETPPERPRRAPEVERRVPEAEKKVTMGVVSGGSAFEAMGGIAAIVLSILGLATVTPIIMAAVAVILLGSGLLLEGAAVAVRYRRLPEAVKTGRWARAELLEGTAAEFLGGLTGIVLGILALVTVVPMLLVPVAVLVLSIALLFGSGATFRLRRLTEEEQQPENALFRWIGSGLITSAAAGLQFFFGLAAGILAVLALIGMVPVTLSLVGLLLLGTAAFLGGAAISGRMVTMLR